MDRAQRELLADRGAGTCPLPRELVARPRTVLGGPGYLAANKVAEDMAATKWWQPTKEMEKYIKTYLE